MYIADEIRCLEGTAENGVSSVDAMKKKSEAAAAAVQQEGRGPQHMPIGEFGGAPALPSQAGPILSAPMYWFYEMSHAALNPSRAFADAAKIYFKSPINPLSYTTFGKSVAAACELFERSTRRYGQPEWGIDATVVGGERVPVRINAVWERPFCRLLHFERTFERPPRRPQPKLLLGGPIDTRANPTAVNRLAQQRGTEWFRRNVITKVPFPHPGFMRDVYPGFLQLNGFMTMNLDRHIEAHKDLFLHLVRGDGDSAQKHREFYDEYLAVMDLVAEFYLQTVDTVFIRHALPKGEMTHRGERVDPGKIHRVALLTVEGENDDISGVGQTEAAHALCVNILADRRVHYLAPSVGHYGVFNGSRFRAEIAPRIADFVPS